MRTFCYYNGFKVTIHKYYIQIRIKMIINMNIHLYISISFNDEHSSFECLFLDFVGPVAHYAVQTNDHTALTRSIQHVCLAWCDIWATISKNKHSVLECTSLNVYHKNYLFWIIFKDIHDKLIKSILMICFQFEIKLSVHYTFEYCYCSFYWRDAECIANRVQASR